MKFEQKQRVISPGMRKTMSSYKDIKITDHAMDRSKERLGINKRVELQKISNEARYKGVNLKALRGNTYESIGLTREEFQFIKNRFSVRNNSTSIFLYKGCIFIFVGNGRRTLKTVVNLNQLV